MKTRFWIASALPLAFAACGGGDAPEGGAADSTAAVSAAPAPEMNPAPAADSGTAAVAGTVAMNAVGASGVTGQVQVMGQGASESMIAVTLNAPGTTTHSGHIHEGTCDAPGKVVVPLQDVTLANGSGTSSTTIPVPVATVMNGNHIVAYHEKSGSEPGSPVVCGAIPAQAAAASM